MKSIKWTLNKEEIQKIAKNAGIFISPVVLIYLGFALIAVNQEGFQVTDLIPNNESITAMVLWTINTLIDVFRKLSAGK